MAGDTNEWEESFEGQNNVVGETVGLLVSRRGLKDAAAPTH